MRNGVIYRKNNKKLLFYVPSEMEKSILFKYHDELGHIGAEKVMEIIYKTYWFPELRKKVVHHVRNCFKCIAYNPPCGKSEGKIQNIPKGAQPFEMVHIDHVTISDVRVPSKKYILVIVDGFSKFVKMYATKTTTSKEAIEKLKIYFCYYSKPKIVVSDRGTCFTSKEFTDFLTEIDIQHVKVATGSPQANGQVERFNRTIALMLGKLSEMDIGKNWTKTITEIEFALNNSVHKTTKEIPSVLLFGISQRGKVHDPISEFMNDCVNEENRCLDLVRDKASENINKQQAQTKAQGDKRKKNPVNYNVQSIEKQ